MRSCLFIAIVVFSSISVSSQAGNVPVGDEEKVQEVVGSLVANRDKAYVLMRDLSETEGHVLLLGVDHFELAAKKKAKAKAKRKAKTNPTDTATVPKPGDKATQGNDRTSSSTSNCATTSP